MDWSHGVEYWSRFLEWNIGVKFLCETENSILVVKFVLVQMNNHKMCKKCINCNTNE